MRLWRRRVQPVDLGWVWINREAAYELAAEMATWPEPIDVIRSAFGLPERWQRKLGHALHATLELIASQMPNITATDAEAARMARLLYGSASFNATYGDVQYNRRKRR